MLRGFLLVLFLMGVGSLAQESGPTTVPATVPKKKENPTPARTKPGTTVTPPSSADPDESSSSKDTKVNMAAPTGEADVTASNETPKWDPHKAMKDVEVGDYYFNEKNYRAAESRYREALEWKAGDAIATYKLARVLEKVGDDMQARQYYESYLKTLPNGEFAEKSRKAIEKIDKSASR